VAIALHGNFDRPEWQCEVWHGVLGARGFILCPRGVPRRDVPKSLDRWEYGSAKGVEKEIDAGLTALRARYGAHVDDGPLLFIGFSLGAIYGSPIVQKYPERFPRAVLVEGGANAWTRASASKFVSGGGERLFIACGQSACLAHVTRLGPLLEKAGLPTRGGGHAKAGHTYDGAVAAAVARELPWLLEGDPRWEP
jgi:predicted esterase